MSEERNDPMLERVRETYNVAGEVPREAMWAAIETRLDPTVDLAAERERRRVPRRFFRVTERSMGWSVAAAAVLVLGIGIGRMTAPAGPVAVTAAGATIDASRGSLTLAAREHFGRTESLLAMVRADAREGRVDPATAGWASELLSETRMLLDANGGGDPTVDELLLDLELVLIQIVGVAETGSMDEAQARTELELALRTLEDGEMLPRIQAAMPQGMSGA
jgi:hypothetical protein